MTNSDPKYGVKSLTGGLDNSKTGVNGQGWVAD